MDSAHRHMAKKIISNRGIYEERMSSTYFDKTKQSNYICP